MARRASTYQKMGWHKASKSFVTELMDCKESAAAVALNFYQDKGVDLLNKIEDEQYYPVYTGNLHDSIAFAVYRRSHVARVKYIYDVSDLGKLATRAQHTNTRKKIWGFREAFDEVYRGIPNGSGITAKLIVGVPYAEGANNKSTHFSGYLQYFETYFESIIVDSDKELTRKFKEERLAKQRAKREAETRAARIANYLKWR